nr:hypothetical protein [Rhizobium leguminosarum]
MRSAEGLRPSSMIMSLCHKYESRRVGSWGLCRLPIRRRLFQIGLVQYAEIRSVTNGFSQSILLGVALLATQACQVPRDTRIIVRDPDPSPKTVDIWLREPRDPALVHLSDYALLAAAAYDEKLAGGAYCPAVVVPRHRWKQLPDYLKSEVETPGGGPFKFGGLRYQLWRNTEATDQKRLALVFRGTDLGELGDWIANLRWLTRLNPFTRDQYAQTRDLVEALTSRVDKDFGPNAEIIAVGHSLGGGLAQQAAYASRRIHTAYAFDSSPVTGSTSADPRVSAANREGDQIFRIYERGEVLAPLRSIQRQLKPIGKNNPKETELRFNFRSTFRLGNPGSGPFSQHSMNQLACDIICWVDMKGDEDQCGPAVP